MSARCGRCRRELSDPKSIAAGFGPECRGKVRRLERMEDERLERACPVRPRGCHDPLSGSRMLHNLAGLLEHIEPLNPVDTSRIEAARQRYRALLAQANLPDQLDPDCPSYETWAQSEDGQGFLAAEREGRTPTAPSSAYRAWLGRQDYCPLAADCPAARAQREGREEQTPDFWADEAFRIVLSYLEGRLSRQDAAELSAFVNRIQDDFNAGGELNLAAGRYRPNTYAVRDEVVSSLMKKLGGK